MEKKRKDRKNILQKPIRKNKKKVRKGRMKHTENGNIKLGD